MTGWLAAIVVASALVPRPSARAAPPVSIDGHVSVMADVLPRTDAVELRPQLRVEVASGAGAFDHVRFGIDALIEALAADRGGSITAARAVVNDGWIELAGQRAEVRGGYGRVIWGRLDEVQPTDVVNPIDAAKFLLDGRAAARLPVPFVRGRVFASEALTVEGVLVPAFRRGTFDALDEASSPFNLVADAAPPILLQGGPAHDAPDVRWSNVSGGGRVSTTVGRVDIAAAAYRGYDAFGVVTLDPAASPFAAGRLVEHHRRFTMIGGDFETIAGAWALRGEAAVFAEKSFAGISRPGIVAGRALDAGVGFDRRAGSVRVFGTLLVHRDWSADDPLIDATNVSVVGSIERQFGRDRYLARAFVVANPSDASAFVRGLLTWSVRDNVSLDASAAVFAGTGDDVLSRFQKRDFGFMRVVLHF